MKTVRDALNAKITGSALSAAIGGRYFPTVAPIGTAAPYVVASIISELPTYKLSHMFVDVLIEFSACAAPGDITAANTISGLVRSLFDDCQLSGLSGYMQVGLMEWYHGYELNEETSYRYVNEYNLQLKKL